MAATTTARRIRTVCAALLVVPAVAGSAVATPATPGTGASAPACAPVPAVDDRCEAWTAAYNHPGGRGGRGEDIGRAVATGGGRVFTTGVSRDDGTSGQDAVLLAYDAATGAALWDKRVNGPGSGYDTYSAVAVSPDGATVYVTGRSDAGGADLEWATAAYDAATGSLRWEARRNPTSGTDQSLDIDLSPDGTIAYVTGGDGVEFPADLRVVAYDTATGAERWSDAYGRETGFDHAWAGAVGADGTFYVTGETEQPGRSYDMVTIAYAADGTRRWVQLFDTASGSDAGFDVAVAGNTVAVAGRSRRASRDITTVVYDAADGAQRWASYYDGGRAADDATDPPSVAVSADGSRVFTAGMSSELPTLADGVTIAYDGATGAVAWQRLYDGPGHDLDYPLDLVAAGGKVIMTGFTEVPRGEIVPVFTIRPRNSMTVAYDAATGDPSWTARHDNSGVGGDVSVAVTASADGKRVFTAGTFVFTGVTLYPSDLLLGYAWDIGTAAYDV